MKTISYSKDALKTLSRMPANTSKLIRSKIVLYAETPDALSNNVVAMQGSDGFRLRVGGWRVIFAESDDAITIEAIGPRGGVYD